MTLFTTLFQYVSMSCCACYADTHKAFGSGMERKGFEYPKTCKFLLFLLPDFVFLFSHKWHLSLFTSTVELAPIETKGKWKLTKSCITWALPKCDNLAIWASLAILSNLKFALHRCLKCFNNSDCQCFGSHNGQKIWAKHRFYANNSLCYSETGGGHSNSFFVPSREVAPFS